MLKKILKNNNKLYFLLRRTKVAIRAWRYGLKGLGSSNYIGRDCQIHKSLRTGDYCLINDHCYIGPSVRMGNFSMLAPRVAIVGGDHRFDICEMPAYFSGRAGVEETVIGHDVWVGFGAIIMSGVTLGDGSIIAAGAIVTKNVGECEIFGGFPAKKLRDRFLDPSEREKHLLAISSNSPEFFDADAKLRLLDE